jgi:hypothetical protein
VEKLDVAFYKTLLQNYKNWPGAQDSSSRPGLITGKGNRSTTTFGGHKNPRIKLANKLKRDLKNTDRFCGLVVRVLGYRFRRPGFDSRHYQGSVQIDVFISGDSLSGSAIRPTASLQSSWGP